MKKTDISFQLYTARKFQPYKNIFEYISSTGVKNLELFALSDFDEKELKDLLQQYNLTTLSAHISFESLEKIQDVLKKIKFLNIKHAIIPAPKAIPGKDFEEFFNLNENEWINFAKEISNKSGVRLYLIKDQQNLVKFVKQNIYGNKIVIGMGAGSISNWIKELPNFL